jgi:hypothetical protein
MRLLGLATVAAILLLTSGCYWGYYYDDYPYYSRAAVGPGYVSYESPYAGVTYHDPCYEPYYYYDYYPYRYYGTYYPRSRRVRYYGYYPSLRYHGGSYHRYPRSGRSPSTYKSFLRKLR